MFADSLLDTPWTDRSRRGWTTLASFAAQVVGVGILLALPLLYTEGLPKLSLISSIAPPSPPPGPPPQRVAARTRTPADSNLWDGHLMVVGRVPVGIDRVVDEQSPDDSGAGSGPFVPGGTGTGGTGNVLNSLLNPEHPAMPIQPRSVTRAPIISRMMEGNLIYKVQPAYPALARSARVQGPVVLRAIISRNGTIENLQVTSGHPLLVPAAVDAVRQWRYRPYMLNGEPVEVETQVTVIFSLAGN